MELTLCAPRIMTIEKRIAHSPKFFSRLARLPKPPLKIKTVHIRPGQPDPPDQAGTLAILVIQTGQDVVPAEDDLNDLAFTPEAEPGISTAAAGPLAPAPQLTAPASRRIKPTRKTARPT